jgi:hypothetical protein
VDFFLKWKSDHLQHVKQTRMIDSESVAAGAGSGFDEMMRFGQVDEIKKKNPSSFVSNVSSG